MKLSAHPGSFWWVLRGAPGFHGSVNEITELFSGAVWATLLWASGGGLLFLDKLGNDVDVRISYQVGEWESS